MKKKFNRKPNRKTSKKQKPNSILKKFQREILIFLLSRICELIFTTFIDILKDEWWMKAFIEYLGVK